LWRAESGLFSSNGGVKRKSQRRREDAPIVHYVKDGNWKIKAKPCQGGGIESKEIKNLEVAQTKT